MHGEQTLVRIVNGNYYPNIYVLFLNYKVDLWKNNLTGILIMKGLVIGIVGIVWSQ